MTPKKWLATSILIIVIVFGGFEHASAVDSKPIGKVVAVRGDAQAVDTSGLSRRLTLKAAVFSKDLLKTGKNGRIQILFDDQTVISLGRNTEMEIVRYAWASDKKSGAMTTRVKEGAFRIMGGAITRNSPENFKTETPAATIGVRGSLYAGIVADDLLSILFQGGTGLDIITPFGSVPLLTPGFGCKVTVGSAPSPPSEFPPADLQRINNQFTPIETTTAPLTSGETSTPPSTVSHRPRNTPPSGDTPVSSDTLSSITPSTSTAKSPLGTTVTDTILNTATTSSQTIINTQVTTQTTTKPTPLPTPNPTPDPTPLPTPDPTPLPTPDPTPLPTPDPTPLPTPDPTPLPTTDPTPPPTPPPAPLPLTFTSGQYLNTLVDDTFWYGPITGVSQNGVATGQSVTQDSTVFPLSFPFTSSYSPTTPYTGVNSSSGLSRLVNLHATDHTFTSMSAHSGTVGEFGYFTTTDSFVDGGGSFNFSEFGFAGEESATLPSTGISIYSGDFLGTAKDIATSALVPASTGNMIMAVNWLNSKVYGFVDVGGKPTMQFYGTVVGNTLAGVTIISDGAEAVGPGVNWHEGTVEFASFYGNNGQGFGLTSLGNTYNIETQAPKEFWRMAGAAFQDSSFAATVSPTGSATLDGMVVAFSEDMTSPNNGRRLFMNHPFDTTPTTFSITVDRDAGVITAGELNAVDLVDPVNTLKHIDIDITNGSAFLDYTMIIAGLGCVGNNCIETGSTPQIGGLKAHGNYFSADGGPTRQIANHVSWGDWELAYDDPTSGLPYHLHIPYSMWIAGEKTPATDIVAKGVSPSFTGRYLGKAYGSRVDTAGFASELTGGTTDLTIDFRPTASTPVSGTIAFDQANLTVFGTAPVTTGGFQAQISAATINSTSSSAVSTSEVNGFFFDPGATSVGGNFSALRADGERLLGIMGGDIQP